MFIYEQRYSSGIQLDINGGLQYTALSAIVWVIELLISSQDLFFNNARLDSQTPFSLIQKDQM
jgi:hypothetical protein